MRTTAELEQLEQALRSLEELAYAEYGQTLDGLLADTSRSQDEKLWRIGRLMGITIKEPFAYPTEIDPATSETGARRGWNLDPSRFDKSAELTWQYELLRGLATDRDLRRAVDLGPSPEMAASFLVPYEWVDGPPSLDNLSSRIANYLNVDRERAEAAARMILARSAGSAPTITDLESWLWEDLSSDLLSPWHIELALQEMQSERGLFRCFAISAHKYLCGNAELSAQLDQSLSAAGVRPASLSPSTLIGAGSVAGADALTNALPWLSTSGTMVTAGLLIIIGNVGLDGFCTWVQQYVVSKQETPDIES